MEGTMPNICETCCEKVGEKARIVLYLSGVGHGSPDALAALRSGLRALVH